MKICYLSCYATIHITHEININDLILKRCSFIENLYCSKGTNKSNSTCQKFA